MLLYIIDGFNLVHKIPTVKKSNEPRRDLINYILNNKLTGSLNNKVIVAFDGYPPDNFSWQGQGNLKVVFSGELSADAVIMRRLQNMPNKPEVVVVSDDREIRDAAKLAGAKICRTGDFIHRANNSKLSSNSEEKSINRALEKEITDELRKHWLEKGS